MHMESTGLERGKREGGGGEKGGEMERREEAGGRKEGEAVGGREEDDRGGGGDGRVKEVCTCSLTVLQWSYLAIPMVTGRMRALAMGTSWCRESGAKEENTRRALSSSGELENLQTQRDGVIF